VVIVPEDLNIERYLESLSGTAGITKAGKRYQQMESLVFRYKLDLDELKAELKGRDKLVSGLRTTIEGQVQGLIALRDSASDLLEAI